MAFVNVVRFTAASAGAGNFVVSSAVTGYQTPTLAGATNGATYSYRAESSDLTQWEIGTGTWTESTLTFSRSAVLFNSSGTGTGSGQTGAGTVINFTAAPQVAFTALAEDLASSAIISAEYLVATATANLSAERVTTDTATVAWDHTTAAQAKANVPDDAITFAKMQNITSDRLLGRDTAASGNVEELTVGGGIEFTGSTGIQTSAFTGDVTKSAGGTATTIANDAVTFAKMQDIATDSLIGRDTASTGDPENITLNATLSMTGSGTLQRAALTGDVTASAGSNSTTIATSAVTNAKMADMAQNTIKGRVTASTGAPEDLTATQGRSVLGLGTAATQNTGTSGANVPLLNAANTWSSAQTMSAAINLTAGQIDFPSTQVPSAGANTLDDYEEGTWTPVLTFGTPGNLNVVYSVQTGTYTKVGRQVMASFDITTSTFTHTTASGDLLVTGLPFAAGANSVGILSWGGITKASYTFVICNINSGATQFNFIASGSAQVRSGVDTGNVPTGGTVNLRGTIVYNV